MDTYFAREPNEAAEHAAITWHGTPPGGRDACARAVDVRTSYRNEPAFRLEGLQAVEPAIREARFAKMIEQDQAVSRNYTRRASVIIERNVDPQFSSLSVGALQEELLGNVRTSLTNLFPGELSLKDFGKPLSDGSFYFRKGAIERFPYMNLSGGEKAAFDLVLDLGLKKLEFNDTVFGIDEPEAHMSTRLQGALLDELLRLVPDNSQLWIATHSIGMMRKSRDRYERDPSQVTFLDFSNKDFDAPVVMEPVEPTRSFWRGVLSVALDDLAGLVLPKTIVVCEGNPRTPVAGRNEEHDARCYSAIFNERMPDVDFVSAGNSNSVTTDRLAVAGSIKKIARGVTIFRSSTETTTRPPRFRHSRPLATACCRAGIWRATCTMMRFSTRCAIAWGDQERRPRSEQLRRRRSRTASTTGTICPTTSRARQVKYSTASAGT
jgi:hypothetical protein